MIATLARRTPRFARFIAAGVVSMAVILAVLTGLQRAGTPADQAYAAALAIAFLLNFAVNRSLVFTGGERRAMGGQAVAYLLASLLFRGAEWAAFALVHAAVAVPAALVAVGVQGVSTLAKYAVFRNVVFRA